MSAGNPPPSRRTVQPASDTRRRTATGPAASPARRGPTRHAHDRQMSPPSRKTPLPMVVHPAGEAKASKELCSCPSNAPIRPIVAITQLPDLGSIIRCRSLPPEPLCLHRCRVDETGGDVEQRQEHLGLLRTG